MSGEIDALKRFSALWGRDMMLVQGAGGNTSLKDGADLLIKASGKRLADAEREEIFLRMPLEVARAGGPITNGSGLRPSIETFLHALMPHQVVAHLHMIEAIAYGVQTNAREALAARLDGLAWGYLDYHKPGQALAEALMAHLVDGVPDILILGNHGILIGGHSCEEVHAVVTLVRERLMLEPRLGATNLPALERLAGDLNLEPARWAEAHLAAADPASFHFATSGTLYPDHVVFLGRGAGSEGRSTGSSLYLAPGLGALLTPGLSEAAHEMAACLGMVASRIPTGAKINVLTSPQEDELINWDAEAYRRKLSGEPARSATPASGAAQ